MLGPELGTTGRGRGGERPGSTVVLGPSGVRRPNLLNESSHIRSPPASHLPGLSPWSLAPRRSLASVTFRSPLLERKICAHISISVNTAVCVVVPTPGKAAPLRVLR